MAHIYVQLGCFSAGVGQSRGDDLHLGPWCVRVEIASERLTKRYSVSRRIYVPSIHFV